MPEPRHDRSAYRTFRRIATRWRDNDVYGHVNNAVYYEYIDTVVNSWLIEQGVLDLPGSPVICLVVETGCTYYVSFAYPDEIEAGLRVVRIGTTSVTYGIGLFRPGADAPSAQARFTHVCVDRATQRPLPLPDGLRAALAQL